MQKFILLICVLITATSSLYAGQSVIIDSDGYACMGDDKSRKETESAAVQEARRLAGEAALTYIQTETEVSDGLLEKDLITAYTNAQVKLIKELLKEWVDDPMSGRCYRVKLKLEVLPDEKTIGERTEQNNRKMLDDPGAPLTVKVWTAQPDYKAKENIKVFLKGNRPFFGKLVYLDAGGNRIQLLPNPYRQDNYFNGGTVYEVPTGLDRFSLQVCPPFGAEELILYASTSPLGELDKKAAGGVYAIQTETKNLSRGVRGIQILTDEDDNKNKASEVAEFAENGCKITTRAK